MSVPLNVDEFVTVNPLTGGQFVTGREFVKMFDFDPDKCRIVVYGDVLRIWQEGLNPVSTQYWRRVPLSA